MRGTLGKLRLAALRPNTSESPAAPRENSKLKLSPLVRSSGPRILDFDIETVAAGFADPEWVPQKITCVAWSWIGSEDVYSHVATPEGLFGKPERRKKMLAVLLDEIRQADMLTGHNIERFDLPVINAEAMRLGLKPISSALAQDTMRVFRSKGFKKGQDNLGGLLKIPAKKLALDWQAWQDAYDTPGWGVIRERAESDVLMHKQMRGELLRLGYLRPPRMWKGR